MLDLQEMRKEIDVIDDQIVKLFENVCLLPKTWQNLK